MTARSRAIRGRARPRNTDKVPLTPALPKPGRAVRACVRALLACGMDEAGALGLIDAMAAQLQRTLHDCDAGMQWAYQVQAQARTRAARMEATDGT